MKKFFSALMLIIALCTNSFANIDTNVIRFNNVDEPRPTSKFTSTQTVTCDTPYGNEKITFYTDGRWSGSCNGITVKGSYEIKSKNRIILYPDGTNQSLECRCMLTYVISTRTWRLSQLIYNGYYYNR